MATKTERSGGRKAVEPGDDPDICRRVAMHVALALECRKWLDRSIGLNYQGRLGEAAEATAKAREFMDQMLEVERTQ
jgi:hypothetical protein